MKINPLSQTIVPTLKSGLDAYAVRHKAIAENIANVDTEGFRPLKVNFEENLQSVMQKSGVTGLRTKPGHMELGKKMIEIQETPANESAPVDIEEEMAELAANQIRFEFATRILNKQYEGLRSSITGRIR